MGFALWVDSEMAWAQGRHEYQPMGAAVVARWRDEQERALRDRGAPHAMDRATLRRFLMHTERLSLHALRVLPARADLCLRLDANRAVRGIET